MVEDVSKRIGIQVNTEDVELAWALCRYLNITSTLLKTEKGTPF